MEWEMAATASGPVGRPAGTIDDAACASFLDNLRLGVGEAAELKSDFTLDLVGVDHISANGLLTMIMARKEAVVAGVKIILARPSPVIREMLDISRYHLIFDIVDEVNLEGRD
jgi:anti-anti-sigma regulatory factor